MPDKLAGILLMIGAIAVLFVLPWLDTSRVRSMRFRPIARWFFFIFIVMCFILGWCGAETPDDEAFLGLSFYRLSQISTLYYFAYFLVILPILGLVEDPEERPASITQAILNYGDKPETEKVLAPAE